MPARRPVVAVVGGGVSGLATAYYAARGTGGDLDVVVLEAAGRLGGKVFTQQVVGHPVDTGPDALLVRVPAMQALLDELGLTPSVVGPGVQGAFVWSRGRLRALPPSTMFGVPQKLLPLVRSGLLSPVGLARAGLDLVLPRTAAVDGGDPSIAQLLRPRFGTEVFERLVDPLLGGVHAGRAELLSARSAVPQVVDLAERSRSIYLGGRRPPGNAAGPAPTGPALVTLEGGLGRLTDGLAAHLDDVRPGVGVDELRRGPDGSYRLQLSDGSHLTADAVVLATPAFETSRLLAELAPDAATAASTVPYADVASLTLVYPKAAVTRALDGTGFLVPPVEQLLLVGCSWLPAKWPHLADPSTVLIRAMVGRYGDQAFTALDDEQLVARVHEELARIMGMAAPPQEAHVQRWPRAMPQYTVGHQSRLDRIDAATTQLPGLHVTGAAYRGVGIASCVANAQRTAHDVVARLSSVRTAG